MSKLSNPTLRYVLAPRIVAETLAFIRAQGVKGEEGVVLWAGRVEGTVCRIVDVVIPAQVTSTYRFDIPNDEIFRILGDLAARRLVVPAQVHSHPGVECHSYADDAGALVQHEGGISIVVPGFGRFPDDEFLDRMLTYRLDEDAVWVEIRGRDLFQIEGEPMSTDDTWYDQHLRTLAALAGIETDRAAELFDRRIHVAIDDALAANRTYALMFTTAVSLVARLFPCVSFDPLPASAFHVLPWGSRATPSPETPPEFVLRIGTGPGDVHVASAGWIVRAGEASAADPREPFNPVVAIIAACYGVAALTARVLGSAVSGKTAFRAFSVLDFADGMVMFDWDAPLELPPLHLAGVGAIGSAFLYTLAAHGRAAGELFLIDHDVVDIFNIGRYLYFDLDDVDCVKVEAARRKLLVHVPTIRTVPVQQLFESWFDDALRRDSRFRVSHLVSCPDRRSTRRSWQAKFPRNVYDASTGPDEVVLHTNDYDPARACMECIYPDVVEEQAHAKHVAAKLGVDVERIVSGEAISATDAEQIEAMYPQLVGTALVGRAFDSVFRDLCGAGQLTVDDHVVLAPFPFISVLAGALLYLEVVKRANAEIFRPFLDVNYTRLNPLQQPNVALRLARSARSDCRCQTPRFRAAFKTIWM